MSKAQLVITAVVSEVRSKAKSQGTTTSPAIGFSNWSNAMKSKGPRRSNPTHADPAKTRAIDTTLDEHIVRLRKTLAKSGYDAGAATIAAHLTRDPAIAKVTRESTGIDRP